MVKDLRESAVKDILDAIKDVQDSFGDNRPSKKRSSGTSMKVSSISRASKDLVMSFPVLCDDSLEPQTAAMICKAIERKCVTMLQLLFASCAFNGDNGRDILAQWHNNIDDSSAYSLDDYLDLCDRFSESSVLNSSDNRMINEAVKHMMVEMKNNKCYPVSSFSEASINDYPVTSRYGDIVVMERKGNFYQHLYNTDNDDFGRIQGANNVRATVQQMKTNKAAEDNYRDQIAYRNLQSDDLKAQMAHRKLQGDDIRSNMADRLDNQMSRAVNRDYQRSQMAANDTNFLAKQLLDNDVKKCNELVPSLMIVRFVSDEGGTAIENQFICGVKARLIPMDTYEIIERINSKNKDRQGLVNFVRATTREISFVKDYLLAIDKAKIEAKNNSIRNHRNSRIWKTLEKRSTKSVWKRLTNQTNSAACITSLVISQQAANTLIKEYGINIADIRTATTIMDAYNLLSIVIVDESTEVARFLFDGDSSYEDLSFSSLERESGDGSYKKVINLLSKMNGR